MSTQEIIDALSVLEETYVIKGVKIRIIQLYILREFKKEVDLIEIRKAYKIYFKERMKRRVNSSEIANGFSRNINYKKNLRIGVYADSINGKTGVTSPYMNFISLFGTPFVITTTMDSEEVMKNIDVLLVPGGADVDSYRYNEPPHPKNSRANMHYEWLDKTILKSALVQGIPVIGICRGFQTINVSLGGTLYQNISFHNQKEDRNVAKQQLITSDGDQFLVNSIHHQAAKKLGEGLVGIGFTAVYKNCESLTDKSGLTLQQYLDKNGHKEELKYYSFCEAFEHTSAPIIAFQYHPEEINCQFAISKIDAMLNRVYATEKVTA